jgi:hypothetical protein
MQVSAQTATPMERCRVSSRRAASPSVARLMPQPLANRASTSKAVAQWMTIVVVS